MHVAEPYPKEGKKRPVHGDDILGEYGGKFKPKLGRPGVGVPRDAVGRRGLVLGNPGGVRGGEKEPKTRHKMKDDEKLEEENDDVGDGHVEVEGEGEFLEALELEKFGELEESGETEQTEHADEAHGVGCGEVVG